ncbi:efflux RND transporter periplasmic adaptor subunit [uncultured Draconibacterium sp.]|uniref:efflux RND transporter periplasmic adaptor subunit n=1 Tax=uncultured Draconibacterium sp. TaxID=1573823 RepID=UPI0029C97EBF|nr:efflux RND transporter periplasmic adaptor subunit [uncultured Draconibacterium sp.]
MKTKFIHLGIVIILFSFAACSSQNETKEETTAVETDVPPSLKDDTEETLLIKLSDKERDELSIKTEKVKSEFVDHQILAPGVVFPSPGHSSIISTPINGQVTAINVYEGDWVNKGQELFRIQSLEYGNLISEYLQAFAQESFQKSRQARLQQLVEERISSTSELEQATAEYQRASASLKSAYAKLRAVGVPDSEIDQFSNSEDFQPTLKIVAPINGVIEKNFVELGQSVNALENLSRVLDTRQVLVRGYVSPGDAVLVKAGNLVDITKREQEEITIKGEITSVNPGLDENSRSVVVNIIISSENGWPKPGENLRLSITSESQKETVAIQLQALTYDGDQPIVFVKKSANTFERRAIDVEQIKGELVFVTSGLSAGEEVAITKVFSLKALSRFDIISEE